MTFDVVTTYGDKHWDEYASRCVSTFRSFWGSEIILSEYTDTVLKYQSSGLAEFKQRHQHRPTDNYRFDAVRFSYKVAAIELAYFEGDEDVMIWMDADCVTHAPVDKEWLSSLIGDADFAYLKRSKKYSETGFMMFRRGRCDELIRQVVKLYTSDALFNLPEWHDCWVIDTVRQCLEKEGLKCVSLSGDAENTGHPLVNGPLGERLDHLKGRRKQYGKSLKTDLKMARKETYWK